MLVYYFFTSNQGKYQIFLTIRKLTPHKRKERELESTHDSKLSFELWKNKHDLVNNQVLFIKYEVEIPIHLGSM